MIQLLLVCSCCCLYAPAAACNQGVVCAGNSVQILDLFTLKKKVLFGHGKTAGCSVGAIAVHPSKNYFAVAEVGVFPNIYIYEYPSYNIVRVLRKGTERAYSDVAFSHTGLKLASVGNAPDYMLTVWDWQQEKVVLRTKAFSQEVFRVTFSPVNEGRLITSGTGHIRFWKMASTFTGLKLQGAIGKFGQVELSDISAYVELPDGRVLSGSETGHMLLWENGFIQYSVEREDGQACHDGAIEFLALEDREIISSGKDGMVRRWPFEKMEFVEVSEEDPVLRLEPLMEVQVGIMGKKVSVVGMLRGEDHWIAQDAKGGLFKIWIPTYEVEQLLDVHAGAITGMEVAPTTHMAVTCGADGTVRCWDIAKAEALFTKSFSSPACCMSWAPDAFDGERRCVLVGFQDGIVRVLQRFADSFRLHHTFKPHSAAVVQLCVSSDGQQLATAAADGSVFFFNVSNMGSRVDPLGFVMLGGAPKSMHWSSNAKRLRMVVGADVVELERPNPLDFVGKDFPAEPHQRRADARISLQNGFDGLSQFIGPVCQRERCNQINRHPIPFNANTAYPSGFDRLFSSCGINNIDQQFADNFPG